MTKQPPNPVTLTERWKAHTISQKTDLRAKLIDAVARHEGWEESAIAMVDEAIMPIIIHQTTPDRLVENLKLMKPDFGEHGPGERTAAYMDAIDDAIAMVRQFYMGDASTRKDEGVGVAVTESPKTVGESPAPESFASEMLRLADRMIECEHSAPWHWVREKALAAMGDSLDRKDEGVDCRAAFEKWASFNSNYAKPDRVMENQAWLGWQASWGERNNIAKGQGRPDNSAATQSPASDIGTLQIGPGRTTICQKCMAKWEECRCEISVLNEEFRQDIHDAIVHGLRHYFSDHRDMTPANIGSATKRIMGKVYVVLKSAKLEPVSVSLEKIHELFVDAYSEVAATEDGQLLDAEKHGLKAVLAAIGVEHVK